MAGDLFFTPLKFFTYSNASARAGRFVAELDLTLKLHNSSISELKGECLPANKHFKVCARLQGEIPNR